MKKMMLIIAATFIWAGSALTQCEEIYLKGYVIDTVKNQGFYNLMVINVTTQQGVFGRPNGEFSVYVRPKDKIAFSVKGYGKKFIEIPKQDRCAIDTVVYLSPNIQKIEEVTVYPIKSLDKIKEEREALSRRETRTVTGVDMLKSPITALYERFSKKAQSKRLVAEMEHQDNINLVVKELIRVYVSFDVVHLEEDQFVGFINFLNIDEHFLKTASDYELIVYIKDKLDHYKSLHPYLFD
ncbi:hypothetical protein DXU93_04620 [Brumimicrobium aurantiacum]|uniref:Carboxypeptidase-like regulatory domain-containing protein n=2 Tax=Brumimicrobium aurantiacum TaxID=1737063 RepID=A0A3E1EZY2_9FLAO|nr:hypothetical protein DXU93_04620 [Brumimicrobium aurantiacum]